MEAISALRLVKVEIVLKDDLASTIAYATVVNSYLSDTDLNSAIATAQNVYDNEAATQSEVNAATTALETAVTTAINKDPLTLINPGFESCTVTTINAAATGSAAPLNIAGAWTQTGSAAWSSSAVVEYDGAGQVNGASAPSADNLGNGGYTLGISVGWGGTVTYKSAAATLPAGVYTVKVNAYNAHSKTQFKSLFGFVPTTGTATLSTKTSFASNAWETDEVTFTLNEATEGCIQVGGQAVSGGSGDNAKVFFDNITITYQDPLSGARTLWEEAVAAAQAAKTNYPIVTGEELTALNAELAKAEPTSIAGYEEATAALEAATDAFIAAKDAYSAFTTAATAEYGILTYATAAKRTALDEACNVTPTSAADAEAKTGAIFTALRAYYESHALAEGVEGAVNMTEAITNAANPSNTSGWTLTNTTGNSNMRTMSNEPWTNSDGSTPSSYFDTNSWGSAFATTMTQDVTLEAGKYLLSVMARGNGTTTYQLTAKEEATDIEAIGNTGGVFGRGWSSYTVEFEVTEDEAGATIGMNLVTGNSGNWLSFGDFKLVQLSKTDVPMAGETEYEALNAAIEEAEAHTLGFDANEYAPYNNVEVLEALATAKAFDTAVENRKKLVIAATEALTTATWTANTEEVNAIYDGDFAIQPEHTTGPTTLAGWTAVEGLRQLIKNTQTDPGLIYASANAAIFTWGGTTITYGEQEGYTLPLDANVYELTIKVAGWRDGDWANWMSAALYKEGNEVETVVKTPTMVGKINDAEGNPFITLTYYLTVPEAGNYTLKLFTNKHTTWTDFNLVKAVAEDITLDETSGYTPVTEETYANVTMTRKVVAGYNTVCLPFDLTAEQVASVFGEDAKVYTFEDVPDGENSTINFNTKEGNTIAANVPVLISDATAVANTETKTVNGVILKSGDAKVAGTNFDFVGTYAPIEAIEAGDYFIGNGALYKSAGATSMKAFRAYIHDKTNGQSGVKLYIDDIETAISEINGIEAEQGVIYNIAGQRVNKAQKGIYIVNGKKVLVK